jgi:hypothetical protein
MRQFARRIVDDHGPGIDIVPVPNGSAVFGSTDDFRTLQLARKMVGASQGALTTFDKLRWSAQMGKSHLKERSRDVNEHLRGLRVKEGGRRRAVIFDDVVTSGSQLCASQIKLQEAGIEVIGMYAVADVVDKGQRGSPPAWRTVVKTPRRQQDFLDMLD